MNIFQEYLEDAGIHIIWFDSLGAKSSSIAIDTGDSYILIDPGAAVMQPSYPLSRDMKKYYRRKAVEKIIEYSSRSDIIIITHYHHDHYLSIHDNDLEGYDTYDGKTLYIKNPNEYINNSQWKRARIFVNELLEKHGYSIEDFYIKPSKRRYRDPLYDLRYIHIRDYGDYSRRRKELLEKGRKWFMKLKTIWSTGPWIRDNILIGNNIRILWGDGRIIKHYNTYVRIGKPCFHGIEYDRTGWVTPVYIENRGYRIFYSSDLMGPIIEDYAYMINDFNPDIVILDGPPTYLFPYMFNKINLERALDNLRLIIDNKPSLIIYDHHLLRHRGWRKYVSRVLEYGSENKVYIITAAEVFGREPLIDTLG